MTRRVRQITAADLQAMTALHALCFPSDHWDERAMAELLAMPGASGQWVEREGGGEPLGMMLDLIIANEAEILTLGVAPAARRQGIASALLEDLFARAREAGAGNVGLEVAADNVAARRLYQQCGFAQTGRRRDYYRRGAGAVDALLFRRALLP